MPRLLSLFKAPTNDLECHHSKIWAGIVHAPEGSHALPLECAKCTRKSKALDELGAFALFLKLIPAKHRKRQLARGSQKTATAGGNR